MPLGPLSQEAPYELPGNTRIPLVVCSLSVLSGPSRTPSRSTRLREPDYVSPNTSASPHRVLGQGNGSFQDPADYSMRPELRTTGLDKPFSWILTSELCSGTQAASKSWFLSTMSVVCPPAHRKRRRPWPRPLLPASPAKRRVECSQAIQEELLQCSSWWGSHMEL